MKSEKKTNRALPLAALALLLGGALILPGCSMTGSSSSGSITFISSSDSTPDAEESTSTTEGEVSSSETSSSDDLPTDPLLRKYVLGLREGADLSETLTIQEIMTLVPRLWAENENNTWYCNGKAVSFGLSQDIQSAGIKAGDSYFSESISKGVLTTGARAYQDADGVDVYRTEKAEAETGKPLVATWGTEATSYTLEEYAESWGYTLDHFGNYYFGDYEQDGVVKNTIITEPTSSEDTAQLSYAKRLENGHYEVYIRLDTVGGVLNYQRQMVTLSGLQDLPPFEFCNLTFELDEELLPISCKVHEKYTATLAALPIPAPTEANLEIAYFPGATASIPELSQAVDYSTSGLFE